MSLKNQLKAIKLVIIIAVLSTIIGYVAFLNIPHILAKTISHTTQTPVMINNITFHSKAFTIQDLIISNPKEAYIPTAFKAEVVEIDASYKQYLKNLIIIDKIEMNNVYINIEFYTEDKIEGNWQDLIENMEVAHQPPSKGKRQALIKKLVLNNVQVTLILSDGKIRRLSPITQLEFDDITSEQGIPTKEISEIIARKMIYTIFRDEGLNLVIKIPIKVIKKILPFL